MCDDWKKQDRDQNQKVSYYFNRININFQNFIKIRIKNINLFPDKMILYLFCMWISFAIKTLSFCRCFFFRKWQSKKQTKNIIKTKDGRKPAIFTGYSGPISGQTLGSYEIKNEIRRTDFSTIYGTYNIEENKSYCMKVIQTHQKMMNSDRLIDRRLREVDIISRTYHPNIQGLKEYILLPRFIVLILESDINQQCIRDLKVCTERFTSFVAHHIMNALRLLHSNGIYHQNITGNSVFISSNGRPSLRDFDYAEYCHILHYNGTQMEMTKRRKDMMMLGKMLIEMVHGWCPRIWGNVKYNEKKLTEMKQKVNQAISSDFIDFLSNLMDIGNMNPIQVHILHRWVRFN